MFPLCDQRGRVLGFGARAMGADQKPKYLNSSDGLVFHKGRHLFGADIARTPAAKAAEVIVAEGYTDVIAMHQAGLRNTVGLMGTALTDEQVGELARLAPTVLLALDADAAGQEAMLRGARVATRRNLTLRVVPLPVGSDPADLVAAEGARAMADRVDASVPFVRFRVERELAAADLSGAEGKDAVIAALRPVFRDLPASAMREELVGLVADRTELAPALVASWLAQGPARSQETGATAGNGASQRRPAMPQPALDAAGRAERAFLAQCLASPAAGRAALAEMDIEAEFSSDLMRRAAVHVHGQLSGAAPALPDDDEFATLIAALTVLSGGMRNSEAAVEGERLSLEVQRVKREIEVAKTAAAGDVGRLVALREELERRRDGAIARSMEETHSRE
jgi:DNA primase